MLVSFQECILYPQNDRIKCKWHKHHYYYYFQLGMALQRIQEEVSKGNQRYWERDLNKELHDIRNSCYDPPNDQLNEPNPEGHHFVGINVRVN